MPPSNSKISPIAKEILPRIIPGQHEIQQKEQEVEGGVHGELEFGLRHLLQKRINLALRDHVQDLLVDDYLRRLFACWRNSMVEELLIVMVIVGDGLQVVVVVDEKIVVNDFNILPILPQLLLLP